MPSKGPKLLTFILESLEDKRFGEKLKWDENEKDVFKILWIHKSGTRWEEKHAEVFLEWDLLKGHCRPNNKHYYTQSKQRFRSALHRLTVFQELEPLKIERHLSFKRYRIIRKNAYRQNERKSNFVEVSEKQERFLEKEHDHWTSSPEYDCSNDYLNEEIQSDEMFDHFELNDEYHLFDELDFNIEPEFWCLRDNSDRSFKMWSRDYRSENDFISDTSSSDSVELPFQENSYSKILSEMLYQS